MSNVMTVRQLIERLHDFDPDQQVFVIVALDATSTKAQPLRSATKNQARRTRTAEGAELSPDACILWPMSVYRA